MYFFEMITYYSALLEPIIVVFSCKCSVALEGLIPCLAFLEGVFPHCTRHQEGVHQDQRGVGS